MSDRFGTQYYTRYTQHIRNNISPLISEKHHITSSPLIVRHTWVKNLQNRYGLSEEHAKKLTSVIFLLIHEGCPPVCMLNYIMRSLGTELNNLSLNLVPVSCELYQKFDLQLLELSSFLTHNCTFIPKSKPNKSISMQSYYSIFTTLNQY